MLRPLYILVLLAASGAAVAAQPVDFMGLNIGTQFNVPECKWHSPHEPSIYDYDHIQDQQTLPCWEYTAGGERPGVQPDPNGSYMVGFIPELSKHPTGVLAIATTVIVVDGKVAGVMAATTGAENQATLFDMLKEKYGLPKSKHIDTIQNRAGASFSNITAQWVKSGVNISFEGITSRIDRGLILVTTPPAEQYIRKKTMENKAKNGSF